MSERKLFSISPERIISFSDAVFAFAITLLVLKIDLPILPHNMIGENLSAILVGLWPQVAANLVTFLVVGYYWIAHHRLFNHITRYTMTLVWLNMLMLFVITLIPFATELWGDFPDKPTAVIFYSLCVALAGIMQLITWLYAIEKHHLIDKSLHTGYLWYHTFRTAAVPAIFLVSIPFAFTHIFLAHVVWGIGFIFLLLATFFFNEPKES